MQQQETFLDSLRKQLSEFSNQQKPLLADTRQLFKEIAEMRNTNFPISAFRVNRKELPTFTTTLDQAKEEIFIVGIELGIVIQEALGYLRKRAKDGCTIRLLILSTTKPDGSPNLLLLDTAQITGQPDLPDFQVFLGNHIERLISWMQSLPYRNFCAIRAKMAQKCEKQMSLKRGKGN
jgi:hypothetical protein